MPLLANDTSPHIATIEHQGRRITVTCRVAFDGIEYVGRLWFADEASGERGIPDRAAIPGRSADEVMAFAHRFTPQELALRHRRAVAEKRRYLQLRAVTDEIINRIRYMNQVAISVRMGMIDHEGAAQEMELIEHQLHDCIGRLQGAAGVEE
jgi:hypothetical protein